MDNITRAVFRRWAPDGTPRRIELVEKNHGAQYEVRLDGEFWSTADNLAQAGDEMHGICETFRLLAHDPCRV